MTIQEIYDLAINMGTGADPRGKKGVEKYLERQKKSYEELPERKKEDFDYQGILTLLKSRLPTYMIPSYLDLLDHFPMLASGKADRKNLPKPIKPLIDCNQSIELPGNQLEEQLVSAWKTIFQLDSISTEADFFLDLAGYSLLAVETISLLRTEYQINLSVRDLYHLKTIKKIAAHLGDEKNNNRDASVDRQEMASSAKDVFKSPTSPASGGPKKAGESWCNYDGPVGFGRDLVGSRHLRKICIDGQEVIDECADFREELCVQGNSGEPPFDNFQTFGGYSHSGH